MGEPVRDLPLVEAVLNPDIGSAGLGEVGTDGVGAAGRESGPVECDRGGSKSNANADEREPSGAGTAEDDRTGSEVTILTMGLGDIGIVSALNEARDGGKVACVLIAVGCMHD